MKESCGCSCSSNHGCPLSSDANICPDCGTDAKKVSLDEVFNFSNKEERTKLRNCDYYTCLNPDCGVAYFTNYGDKIKVDGLRRPISFKKSAE